MNDMKAAVGEIRATVHIRRAATGKIETYELVGRVNAEQADALGLAHPRVHGAVGAMTGPGAIVTVNEKE